MPGVYHDGVAAVYVAILFRHHCCLLCVHYLNGGLLLLTTAGIPLSLYSFHLHGFCIAFIFTTAFYTSVRFTFVVLMVAILNATICL